MDKVRNSIRRRHTLVGAFVATIALASCELFVVGGGARQRAVEVSQRTSIGVVYLFKAELDSNNTAAATELILHPSGRRLLAVEKYEMRDDMARWQRLLVGKPITAYAIDTLDQSSHSVETTFDHIRKVRVSTKRIEGTWYITKLADKP